MGVSNLIQVSPATAKPAHPSARPTGAAASGKPGFASTLGAVLAPGAPAADAVAEGDEGLHKLAGTGKKLPDELSQGDADAEDDGPDAEDMPFAWFGIQPLPVQATPLGIQLPRPANAIILPDGKVPGTAPELSFPGAAVAATGFGTEPAPQTGEAAPAPFVLPADIAPAPAQPAASAIAMASAEQGKVPEAPVRIEIAAAADTGGSPRIELPLRHQATAAQLAAQPAEQAKVAPIVISTLIPVQIEPLVQTRRAARETDLTVTAPVIGIEAPRTHVVTPAGDVQQAPLDTRRQEWMTTMIDRIETLRDSSGSRETTIRLSPDALGTVDVSIRHDGDRVHVHIQADSPAARTLLAEAHPRLAELAEAKGIRLGQTSVDAGTAGQSNAGQNGQRQDAPRVPVSAAPKSARTSIETTSDERVA